MKRCSKCHELKPGTEFYKDKRTKGKPENPYSKETLIWSVMEGDWADLTIEQIAEVLSTSPHCIRSCINKIRVATGYEVPRERGVPGPKKDPDDVEKYASPETKTRKKAQRKAKKKVNCEGCVYWRNTAYGNINNTGISCCHYLLDTGRSRLKLCGPGGCTVRVERGGKKKEAKGDE